MTQQEQVGQDESVERSTSAQGQPSQQGSARRAPTGPVEPHPQLDRLIAVLEELRAPGGCAWDREQTHESLVRYLVEETYELIDAIESGDRDELIEELGDVLYQVIFHSDIAAHTPGEDFTLEDVAAHMTAKMIGRHPHVFGDATAETAAEVTIAWDEIKKVEKPTRSSVLDGVPQGMPALALADKLLGKAAKLGMEGDGGPVGAAGLGATSLGARSSGATSFGTASLGAVSSDAPIFGATIFDSEADLGAALLATVAAARNHGLDSERALRGALREFQSEMRAAEAVQAAVDGALPNPNSGEHPNQRIRANIAGRANRPESNQR